MRQQFPFARLCVTSFIALTAAMPVYADMAFNRLSTFATPDNMAEGEDTARAQAVPTPQLIETKAAQAYLVEASTGTVLLAKNERQSFAPASLAKLMTMDLIFEALTKGEVTLDTTAPLRRAMTFYTRRGYRSRSVAASKPRRAMTPGR